MTVAEFLWKSWTKWRAHELSRLFLLAELHSLDNIRFCLDADLSTCKMYSRLDVTWRRALAINNKWLYTSRTLSGEVKWTSLLSQASWWRWNNGKSFGSGCRRERDERPRGNWRTTSKNKTPRRSVLTHNFTARVCSAVGPTRESDFMISALVTTQHATLHRFMANIGLQVNLC